MRVHLCVCVCVCACVCVCVCFCIYSLIFVNPVQLFVETKIKSVTVNTYLFQNFGLGQSPCSPIPKLWFLGKPKRNIVKASCQTATQPHVNPSEIYFSFFACCVYVLTRKKLFKVVTKNDSSWGVLPEAKYLDSFWQAQNSLLHFFFARFKLNHQRILV